MYVRGIDKRKREAFSIPIELRAEGEGSAQKIVGHAAVFDAETELFRGYFEVVRKGAFAKALAERAGKPDVKALYDHDNPILGSLAAGTLSLSEDETGLRMEITPDADNQLVRDYVLRPMARGELGGASFAFRAIVDRETHNAESGTWLRELLEVELYDVSVVKWGQYDEAGAALRSLLRTCRCSALSTAASLRVTSPSLRPSWMRALWATCLLSVRVRTLASWPNPLNETKRTITNRINPLVFTGCFIIWFVFLVRQWVAIRV